MTLQTQQSLRQGRVVHKSHHQSERNNPDGDGAPGPSSELGQPNNTCATQPARHSQRGAKAVPAEHTALQTQPPGSSAGPGSLLTPITDLSAPEAAAGLPPKHRPRTRSEHRASLQHVENPSANAEAAASGSARKPSARRCTRQEAGEDGDARPLQPDADDITADAGLRWSASAAPKRRRLAAEAKCPPGTTAMTRPHMLEDLINSSTNDRHSRPPAKVQRLGELCGRSESQDVLESTDVGERDQRTQMQQATRAINMKEPEPASAGVTVVPTGGTVGLALPSAAIQIEDVPLVDWQEGLRTEESEEDVMLIASQEDPVDLRDSSQQEDDPVDLLDSSQQEDDPVDLLNSSQQDDSPVDLLDSSQQEDSTLEAVPEEPEIAHHELFFSCAICLEEHSMEDCYIARMCGHRMCRDAAREVVLGAVRSCSFPVLCPICQAKSEPKCIPCCKREAALAAAQEAGRAEDVPSGPSAWCCTLDVDIPLLLTVEEEEHYLERSLKAAANSCAELVTCPRPDCKGVAVTGLEDESPALKCNVCKHEWCWKCNVDWHSNTTCEDYQLVLGQKVAEEGLEEYQKKNRIVKCPNCKHGIERISGCDHMKCTRCKTPFCWRCGQKRTAQHDAKCGPAAQAARAYAAGRGAPGPRRPAHWGPAPGLLALPAPFQPAQPGAPWPWLQPGIAAMLPGGIAAPPAPAHVAPALAPPHFAIAPPRAAAPGGPPAPRTMLASKPAS